MLDSNQNFTVSKDYSKQINLDLTPFPLIDRPANFMNSSYYEAFEYVLPSDFIKKGNPKLKSYTAWYDQNNIKGMQFIFSNNFTEIKTPVFGNQAGVNGSSAYEVKTI